MHSYRVGGGAEEAKQSKKIQVRQDNGKIELIRRKEFIFLSKYSDVLIRADTALS